MATFRFNVSFDATKPTPVSVTPILPTAPPYHAPPEEISLITFTLDNSSGAEFPTNPIQWLVGNEPVALPPWFAMHRRDAGYFSLWDFNSAPISTHHHFIVSVFHDGRFFSTQDPTIINDPPVDT
jgi:hypothetical protein